MPPTQPQPADAHTRAPAYTLGGGRGAREPPLRRRPSGAPSARYFVVAVLLLAAALALLVLVVVAAAAAAWTAPPAAAALILQPSTTPLQPFATAAAATSPAPAPPATAVASASAHPPPTHPAPVRLPSAAPCALHLRDVRAGAWGACCVLDAPLPTACGDGDGPPVTHRLDSIAAVAQRLIPRGDRYAWLAFFGDSIVRLEFQLLAQTAAGAPGWPDLHTLRYFFCEGNAKEAAVGPPRYHSFACAAGDRALSLEGARQHLAGLVAAASDVPGRVVFAAIYEYVLSPVSLPAFGARYPAPDPDGVLSVARRIMVNAEPPGAGDNVRPTVLIINPGLHPVVRNMSAAEFRAQLREMFLGLEELTRLQLAQARPLRAIAARAAATTRVVQHLLNPVENERLDPGNVWKRLQFVDASIRPMNAALDDEWRLHAARCAAVANGARPASPPLVELLDTYAWIAGGHAWRGATWTTTTDGWHFNRSFSAAVLWVDLHLAASDGPLFLVAERNDTWKRV